MRVSEREMTEDEASFLHGMSGARPARRRKLMMIAGKVFVTWAILLLLSMIAWKFVAWIARVWFDAQFSRGSTAVAIWLLPVVGIATLVLSIISTARWVRGWSDLREPLSADIRNRRVRVEEYEFLEAVVMQEPEHLGLIYFMREDDDGAFVYFDAESQDPGIQGDDPFSSSFVPAQRLCVIRAPESRVAISRQFSGDPLDPVGPVEMSVPPERWPEHEEVCAVPWSDLMSTCSR